jgi:hypothetical protein
MFLNKKHYTIVKRITLLALFIGALTGCKDFHEDLKISLQQNLFEPYFEHIQRGNLRVAYDTFTSKRYKSYNTWEDYQQHHQKVRRDKGPILQFRLNTVRVSKSIFGAPDEIRVEVGCIFEGNYKKPLLFILSEDGQGGHLIDAAWNNPKYGIPDGYDGPW